MDRWIDRQGSDVDSDRPGIDKGIMNIDIDMDIDVGIIWI